MPISFLSDTIKQQKNQYKVIIKKKTYPISQLSSAASCSTTLFLLLIKSLTSLSLT